MRLDFYLVEKGYFDSRTKAKQAIERGEIFINGKKIEKPAFDVVDTPDVKHVFASKFVSLGGFKIEKALNDFEYPVNDLIVADIGASTGGFTDCLIQKGAKKVYAVDLNDQLLHKELKDNDKVKLIVKNAKDLEASDFDEDLDLLVADLSFISITQVIPAFSRLINKGKKMLLLIKPQFEIGQYKKFKNGIIRDEKIHLSVCEKVIDTAKQFGFEKIQLTTAPLNKDKNIEFLILFDKV